jgi:hypothetical protein
MILKCLSPMILGAINIQCLEALMELIDLLKSIILINGDTNLQLLPYIIPVKAL